MPQFRNVTLKCFTEIAGLSVGPEYDSKFTTLFGMVLESVMNVLPLTINLADVYENSSDKEQNFIQNLALFLSTFLGIHLKRVEAAAASNHRYQELIMVAHNYLLRICLVKDREIFKICLEYWAKLVAELYDEIQASPTTDMQILNLASRSSSGSFRRNRYTEILSNLRVVMIERMVKPEEVLIVENDEGEIVREFMKEGDTITLYKSMREVLVYLTHLDTQDTENVMTDKLSKQVKFIFVSSVDGRK